MLAEYAFPIMLAILLTITVTGTPMGLAMIASSVFYLAMSGRDVGLAAESVLNGIFGNFVALAVPLFIFAANIMNAGQISDRLLKFALALVGRFPGGLAQVNVLTSLIFSGMSGSAVSDVAGVGKVLTDMMTDKGRYPPGFAGAITAASSVVGPIFPPSIPLVFYALVSSTSVGVLFLAGVIPAMLIVAALGITVMIVSRRRGFPVEPAIALRAFPLIVLRAIPPLLMPVILLGGIYSGAFTPTEAAAVAAAYALLLSVIAYRALGWRAFYGVVLESARTTAVITIILCGAYIFNYVVSVERLPEAMLALFNSYQMEPWMFLLMVNLLFLVLGCFIDVSTILLVVVPLFIPTALLLGIDLNHFGIVVVVNLMIGLITPPYGILLFILKATNGIPLNAMIREIWLFIAVLIAALLVITYFPALSLWLPKVAGLL
ncbi:TRAP transporter large permease [Oceaniglobus indicus]|uniref:TRAP transporter large permease n=1 Tax=Oceaniglobus indicus TaxID=2047749 RepID=UPI000C196404|nr:TRAP transporter large permease [Oceaniglobus indicus]